MRTVYPILRNLGECVIMGGIHCPTDKKKSEVHFILNKILTTGDVKDHGRVFWGAQFLGKYLCTGKTANICALGKQQIPLINWPLQQFILLSPPHHQRASVDEKMLGKGYLITQLNLFAFGFLFEYTQRPFASYASYT